MTDDFDIRTCPLEPSADGSPTARSRLSLWPSDHPRQSGRGGVALRADSGRCVLGAMRVPQHEARSRDGGEHLSGEADSIDPLSVARDLIQAGIPVFVAKPATNPDGSWNPHGGHNGCGYWLPEGWQLTEPDVHVLDDYMPEVPWYLGNISRSKVYKLLATGELTRVRIGSRAFISGESITAFLTKVLTSGGAA